MINISEHNGERMVDARELHGFLEVARDFSTWIQDRIKKYRFVEGIDYIVLEGSPDRGNGHYNPKPSKDYALTLDMAKSIAMVQNNNKGDEVRQYFISCEKKLNQIRKQMTPLEMHLETLRQMVEVERRTTQAIDEQKAETQQLKRVVGALRDDFTAVKAAAELDAAFVTIAGFLSISGIKNKTKEEIRILGMRVSKHCKENGIKIAQVPSVTHGKVNAYPREVLEMLIGEMK